MTSLGLEDENSDQYGRVMRLVNRIMGATGKQEMRLWFTLSRRQCRVWLLLEGTVSESFFEESNLEFLPLRIATPRS